MLSYRHAFHAGNHADVLKHFVQIQLHEYMNQKDTAYTYIDTHSGAGVYALDGGYASKNAEYETGIGPLWERNDLPKALADYVDLVKGMNPSGKMRYYPGSPYCADKMMREQDRLRLFELHPADSKILADNFRKVEEHAAAAGRAPVRTRQARADRARRRLPRHQDAAAAAIAPRAGADRPAVRRQAGLPQGARRAGRCRWRASRAACMRSGIRCCSAWSRASSPTSSSACRPRNG